MFFSIYNKRMSFFCAFFLNDVKPFGFIAYGDHNIFINCSDLVLIVYCC